MIGCRGLVIAGTQSGVGKTTVTLGLLSALRRRNLTVQPFKVLQANGLQIVVWG